MNHREQRILTVTCSAHFMSHFNMLVFPAIVLPLAPVLELSMAATLGLSFWMYLLFGLTSLPWGLAADRWGARYLILLFHGGSAACGFLCAIFISRPEVLVLCLAGLGIFSGIYHPVGTGMISKEVRRLSRGLALNGIFGNLGMAMAPLLAGLATWIWSPQAAFVILGLMNLGGLMLVYSLYRPTGPPAHEHSTSGRSANLGAFAVLLVATTLCGIIYRGATATIPAYLELKNSALVAWVTASGLSGMTPNLLATVSVSGIFLVGMFGQYLGGRVGERYDLRLCYLAFHSIPAACAVLIGCASNLLLILCAAVYFFFLIGMQPIENTLVARYTSPRFHHSAYGTKFILTFGVGAFAIKLVQIIETGPGIVWVFPALGVISLLLTGVIGLLILTTRRNH